MINQEDWSWTKLGDFISIKHGWPFKSEYMSDYLHGRPIIVSIGNFEYTGGFRFASTTLKAYTGEFPQEFILKPDDILLAMTCQTPKGEILGIPGRIPDDGRIYLHNQRMGKVIIKCKDKVDVGFLYWLFLTSEFNRHLVATATGTKILHTAPDRIESFQCLLPPFPEQLKIANILSTWDRAIDLTAQLIAAKQQYKRGLMQQLLTGKRRFPQFNEQWQTIKIDDIISESRISGSDGRTARKITVRLYGKGVVPKEERNTGSEATKYYQRRAGQFIYSKLDFLNGAFGIILPEMDGYESTLDLPCFDFKGIMDAQFFLYFVSRECFYSRFAAAAIGGRKARRIQVEEFLASEIVAPRREEQEQIVAFLSSCDQELSLLNRKLELLKKQKQGLMQQLLTGKVRVKT